jgi:hypothetical protein
MPDDAHLRSPAHSQLIDSMVAERLNRVAGEVLLVDAETALTLLDIADMTQDRSMAQNDFDRASEALATINHFLKRLDLESDFRSQIESARNQLRERVKEMWPQFRSN